MELVGHIAGCNGNHRKLLNKQVLHGSKFKFHSYKTLVYALDIV